MDSRREVLQAAKAWLIERERRYRGGNRHVPLRRTSRLDPRSPERLDGRMMRGGDRMEAHGYAWAYAVSLMDRFGTLPIEGRFVVVELGILRGHGLALLCDLFPQSRVIGLDIDIAHCKAFIPALAERGAFSTTRPELYEFDEMEPMARERLAAILAGDRIDVMIDDAIHRAWVMAEMYEKARPLLAKDHLYFMEDNGGVYRLLSDYKVKVAGELTVIRGGEASDGLLQ